jgi:hypothetical protein
MNRFVMDGKMMYVNVFRLFILPDGRFVVTAGNVKLEVTPEEAVKLFEYVLSSVDQFSFDSTPHQLSEFDGNILKPLR